MKAKKSLGQIARKSVSKKYAGWQPVAEIANDDWDIAARAVEREVLKHRKGRMARNLRAIRALK
jgi:hypothetical protein